MTVIPPAGVETSDIRATIANTEQYSVVIDGTTHSTDYFDYVERNNTATLKARPGTGDGAPGAPRGLRVLRSSDPPLVFVSWDRLEQLYGFSVTGYEVYESSSPACERQSPPLEPSEGVRLVSDPVFLDGSFRAGVEKCYWVRAVNEHSVGGYWSPVVSTRGGGSLRSVSVTPEELTVSEMGGTASYSVVLDSQPTAPVIVTIGSDSDVVELSRKRLEFSTADWKIPRTITVTGVDDDVDNPGNRRTATVRHSVSGGGFDGASVPSVLVTVADDDDGLGVVVSTDRLTVAEAGGTGQYAVVLSSRPTGWVEIGLESSDTGAVSVAPSRLTFNPSDWDQARKVTITGVDDNVDNTDNRRSATIRHTVNGGGYGGVEVPSVAVTVLDDDGSAVAAVSVSETAVTVSENAGTARYMVALSAKPSDAVVIAAVTDDSSVATAHPSLLTFTPDNWQSPRLVTVTGVDDDVDNPTARSTTVLHTPSGGGYSGVEVPSVDVTVSDDEQAGISVSETEVTVGENGGTGQYTVSLNSQPTGPVTVNVVSLNPTIARVGPATLSFDASDWNIPAVVTVTGQNDHIDNSGNQRPATIRHTATGGGYGTVAAQTVEVAVTDDDSTEVTVPAGLVSVVENGGTSRYSVRLNSRPSSPVTITLSTNDSEIASVDPTTLEFDPGNWNRSQTVTITSKGSSGTSTAISHTAASTDAGYNGIDISSVTVSVVPKPFVSIEGGSCVIGGEDAVFTIMADRPVGADLKVSFYLGSNWRVLVGNPRSESATIPAGEQSVQHRVRTTNPTASGTGTWQPYKYIDGTPGSVTAVLEPWRTDQTGNYNTGLGTANASVKVYHPLESRYCHR
ncbi:MAG: hypothetical protein F4Y75_03825 [Acidimicrobiia bacterium]|nr:hypothetical protein [Acidimicrobiia bacterium]